MTRAEGRGIVSPQKFERVLKAGNRILPPCPLTIAIIERALLAGIVVDYERCEMTFAWAHGGESERMYTFPKGDYIAAPREGTVMRWKWEWHPEHVKWRDKTPSDKFSIIVTGIICAAIAALVLTLVQPCGYGGGFTGCVIQTMNHDN